MRLKDVQKNTTKDVVLTIRTTEEDFSWLKDHKVSPSLLFEQALKELITEVDNQEETEKNFVKFISPRKK